MPKMVCTLGVGTTPHRDGSRVLLICRVRLYNDAIIGLLNPAAKHDGGRRRR